MVNLYAHAAVARYVIQNGVKMEALANRLSDESIKFIPSSELGMPPASMLTLGD